MLDDVEGARFVRDALVELVETCFDDRGGSRRARSPKGLDACLTTERLTIAPLAPADATAFVGLRQESRQVDADWFTGEWTTLDGFAVLASEWDRE